MAWQNASLEKEAFKKFNSFDRQLSATTRWELDKKIASFHKTQTKNIFISSGSMPAIYLLAQIFQKSSALILEPTFREYHDACQNYKIKIKRHKWFSFSKKKLNGWKKKLKKKIEKFL